MLFFRFVWLSNDACYLAKLCLGPGSEPTKFVFSTPLSPSSISRSLKYLGAHCWEAILWKENTVRRPSSKSLSVVCCAVLCSTSADDFVNSCRNIIVHCQYLTKNIVFKQLAALLGQVILKKTDIRRAIFQITLSFVGLSWKFIEAMVGRIDFFKTTYGNRQRLLRRWKRPHQFRLISCVGRLQICKKRFVTISRRKSSQCVFN